jgi:hypothetical protein
MSESTGDSSHHSMQLWLNRRFTNRLAFQVAYTWGHTISNVPVTSFQTATTDPFNYDLDKGDADLDRRHQPGSETLCMYSPGFRKWGKFCASRARRLAAQWHRHLPWRCPIDVHQELTRPVSKRNLRSDRISCLAFPSISITGSLPEPGSLPIAWLKVSSEV